MAIDLPHEVMLQHHVCAVVDKPSPTIAENRKARHDYFIEDRYEAGLALEGWEVKSLRAGRAQLKESYVYVRNGEAWLRRALFAVDLDFDACACGPDCTRKLLLHRHQLDHLVGAVERRGYTVVPLCSHWKQGRAVGNRVCEGQETA